jgi:heterotetrameric sarcosine oxidase gamma subunit
VAETTAVARSPIPPAPPVGFFAGWEISLARVEAPLTLADCTPLAKVLVRAEPGGGVADRLATPHGAARRDGAGTLILGSGPGEWLLLAAPGAAPGLVDRWRAAAGDDLVTVLDVTSGRVALRLTGPAAAEVLAKVCALDLARAPDGSAYRSSVAKAVTEIVRDDRPGTPSYLLLCDRSFGRYLAEALLDTGTEFGIAITGFNAEDKP